MTMLNGTTLRVAVYGLIVVLLVDVVGMIWLTTLDKHIPSVLEMLATGALTGLLGLLVPYKDGHE